MNKMNSNIKKIDQDNKEDDDAEDDTDEKSNPFSFKKFLNKNYYYRYVTSNKYTFI